LTEFSPDEISLRLLQLREEVADRDATQGGKLQNASAGLLQGSVLPVCLFNQSVESRVAKDVPPLGEVGRRAGNVSFAVVNPVRAHGGCQAMIVGSDLETISNPVTQRAPTGEKAGAGNAGQKPPYDNGRAAHCAHLVLGIFDTVVIIGKTEPS